MAQSAPADTVSVRVLVVDDQELMRDGIASLLNVQEGITVVGTAADGVAAVEQARLLNPDVVLMDVRMPLLDGVAATAQITQQLPACQVLMLTTFDDEEYVHEALRLGARGYLLKDMPAQALAQAIRAAHQGIYQLDPTIAQKVIAGAPAQRLPVAPAAQPPALPSRLQGELSNREREVLSLVATGATNREIAETLMISEGTVKNHIANIFGRLGLRDRTQAAVYAREQRLI